TNEDHAELRALERFIGRGLVRKKAEGFNYSQSAPEFSPAEAGRQQGRGPTHQGQPQRHQPSPRPGQSNPPHHGGRPRHHQSSRRRWR
ncbi:MAG TPA: ATP-dependent helicase, partial [Verrucomicrobiae bacterium]|nr:ATP-dependent helicase [Verrucomicrobiae bacterium]